MESTLVAEARVSSDGKLVLFVATIRDRGVQCSISRRALEEHFWAPIGASDARLLKAYADGRNRVAAAVERKMLRAPSELIQLNGADFNH